MFDWDNFFASLIGGMDSKEIAYSNLIQTVASKTAAGFIPNFQSGGQKSQDRTEPANGARVLLQLFNKYKDKWLVELLFDSLVQWNDWFFADRLQEPEGLIALGSDPTYGGNSMQGARFESGLDNSPMYDCSKDWCQTGAHAFYNRSTHMMNEYDVGMTSLVISEAYALSELSKVIGREEVGKRLEDRAKAMAGRLQTLWNDDLSIFVNKFTNGTFYNRISPTSFYPLLARAATTQQAEEMVSKWLLNNTRFCINLNWPVKNTNDCYWGLPSISADDPAYPALGYWRGYIWGPMIQFVYWGLKEYDHSTIVRTARKAMAKQLNEMFLNQWHRHRHVCENFGPHEDTPDCTGNKFYHWGALAGLIQLEEAGFY